MKRTLPLVLAAACLAGTSSAQFYTPTEQPIPNVTSVTNEGVAVGYNDQNQSFYVWDAVNNTMRLIGGISSGAGVGGNPRFSESGKLIAAPMQSDAINVYTAWTSTTFPTFANYEFRRTHYMGDWDLFAIGSTPDGKGGIIVKSVNNGVSWDRADDLSRQKEDGTWEMYKPDFPIYCMAGAQYGSIIAGCGNGVLLFGRGNGFWEKTSLSGFTLDKGIEAYRDMSFTYIIDKYERADADRGCILLELEDGSFKVVFTLDGTESFSIAEGTAAKPSTLGNNGTDFFLGTSDGLIQTSADGGKTWTTVFTDADKRPIHRIVFADSNKGVALSDNVIYITRDGGKTWELATVFPSLGIGNGNQQTSTWNDAVWMDDYFTIIGTNGCCYKSTDDGKTFTKIDGFSGDLGTLFYDKRMACTIFGQSGKVWRKADQGLISGYTAGLYDMEADTWTPLPSTGYVSDAASAPWNISGDGKHPIGVAYGFDITCNKVVTHAAIWDGTEKVTLLPNRFASTGRACRANAVSYDGSVVAGWQDVWGRWFGSVWRKGADGLYTQEILSVDKEKNQDNINFEDKDECAKYLTGYCQTVSPDGKWFAGRGIPQLTAVDGAWIYSKENGFNVIYPGEDSTVADINSDGTMAVGWCGPGVGAWIWTKENGIEYLQNYVEKKLGHELEDFGIVSVYDMSPNGRYICGYGMKGGNPVGYVFDLHTNSGVEEMECSQVKANIYPNPASDEIHVDLPFDGSEVKTTLTLVDMRGQTMRRLDATSTSNVIDIRDLARGIYVLDVNANGKHKTFKVIVK